jgi:hypothetical protein
MALPGHETSPFAWLESIAPPLLVLSTAYVLKEQVLETIEQRHADEQAFQTILAEWQSSTVEPEQHPKWEQFYANALRDALFKANGRRQEILNSMSIEDWRASVYREMRADVWYEIPNTRGEIPAIVIENTVVPSNHNGNGTRPKASAAIVSGTV